MDLEGRTALVTGASRRVGKAIVMALSRAGCRVVVHFGGSKDRGDRVAEELYDAGGDAWSVGADLRRPEQIEQLFAEVKRRNGGLDILVNSAAGFESGEFQEISVEHWDRVMALNLRAPFLCMQQAAILMRGSEREETAPGAIVNIADLSGVLPWSGRAAHAVSKAGLLHLTQVAARELAPDVRVNAVIPGAILPPPGVSTASPEWQKIGKRIPAGKPGNPGNVADAVLFLVRNDFVTGESIFVDGGERLQGAAGRPG